MRYAKAKWAIRKIARKQGLSEKEVVTEIEEAIAEAIICAAKEKDANALELWKEIPCEGAYPNAYELVDYLAGKVSGRFGA